MSVYRLAPEAVEDLAQIWDYIAADSPSAAERVEADIIRECRRIAEMPGVGHLRDDLTEQPIRSCRVHRYSIFYTETPEGVHILRIVSGYRDLRKLFPPS